MKYLILSALISLSALALDVPKECVSSEDYSLSGNESFDKRVIKNQTPTPVPAPNAPVIIYRNTNSSGYISVSCFGKGTRVRVPKSLNSQGWVNIENIKIGDTVYSYDHTSKKMVTGKISEVRQVQKPLCLITAGQTKIKATGDHPFFSLSDDKYRPISILLKKDDQITQYSFDQESLINKTVDSIEYLGVQTVYDIRVEKYHNFFVNSNILVHNW